jgi:hypothetical protein
MPRQSLDGLRTHVIITKYQDRELRKLTKESGMTVAEHLRRAIDFYLASLADRLSTKRQ